MTNKIDITSGSDATLQFAFTDEGGDPIAVSNPVIIFAQGPLGDRVSATLVDGQGGLVSVFIEGTDPIPVGGYFLRLQVELTNGDTLASEKVLINVR